MSDQYITNKPLEKIKQGIGGAPMGDKAAELFVLCATNEAANINGCFAESASTIPDDKLNFVMKVARLRIEGMKLPIEFTKTGFLAATALSEGNVGRMVTILIDCLTEYEGDRKITADKLAKLYPMGMYSNTAFEDYIDNYLKPRKVKWAEVY